MERARHGPALAVDPARTPPAAPALLGATLAASLLLGACQPTVRVEAPDKPIEINLNIKIEQEVRVRVERDAEQLIQTRPDIF